MPEFPVLIRKLYRFEASHIVRNCTSERCRSSLHGHSYVAEVFLTSDQPDRGHMVVDFGLLKRSVAPFIDAFDHSLLYWSGEQAAFREAAMRHSARYVELPVSPSAEMLALVFMTALDRILNCIDFRNGETGVQVHSVRVHETATGYAESDRNDLSGHGWPAIRLADIRFSDAVRADLPETDWWDRIVAGELRIECPPVVYSDPLM